MNRLSYFLLAALLSLGSVLAASESLSLTDARRLAAENSPQVGTARAASQSARRSLERAEADPLVTPLALLRARNGSANADAALQSAILNAESEALGAFTAALDAANTLRSAELALEMAGITADAARIRLNAGAATQLDLDRASNDLSSAERRHAEALTALELARSSLASLLGSDADVKLQPVSEPAPTAPLEEVLLQLQRSNPQLAQARQAVEIAELELAAADTPLSSRAQIEQAGSSLASAEAELESIERSLNISVRQAHNSVLSARGNHAGALATLATAREAFAAQQLRFEAGSISQLDLLQAELDLLQSEAQSASALHALLSAVQSLGSSVSGGGR